MHMITSKTKQKLAQLCLLSVYLDPASLFIMYKSFVRSCLKYMGHLLYFGAAKSHLDCPDALQHRAAGICHCTFHPWNQTGMLQQLLIVGW